MVVASHFNSVCFVFARGVASLQDGCYQEESAARDNICAESS